jgi:hypothetical protein
MLEHIAFLVPDAALHGYCAKDLVDGRPQGFAAIQDDQDALFDVKAAADEVGEQMDGDGLVLCRAIPEPERDLDPLGADAQGDDAAGPFSSIPSSINAARRTSESGRAISAARCSPVRETNSRLTVDFDVERSDRTTASPMGSRVLANLRVETPASICSNTTLLNGSRSAKYAYVASGTSCSPSTLRTRGCFTATRRPPSVTVPSSWP